MNSFQFLEKLEQIIEDDWPTGFRMLRAVSLLRTGASDEEVQRIVRTSGTHLRKLKQATDPVGHVLGVDPAALTDVRRGKARQILGSLLVGRCAEMVFEDAYKREVHTDELELRDLRESRSDTDYRLYNGNKRPLYRINIKFHGSRFRRAPELVGLDPEDCFALATYKIYGALKKQEQEGLPYIFAIVGVSGLRAENVGAAFVDDDVEVLSIVQESRLSGKRDIEEAIVERAVSQRSNAFTTTFADIAAADWYLLSARRADDLLRKYLYERVFALRVRGFAQTFRGAELDMHFSLKRDLTPLAKYFEMVRDEGQVKVATLLERGVI